MPIFDAKILDADPEGNTLLAAVLFPSARDKSDAIRRGRERLARAGSIAEAMAAGPAVDGERTRSADPVV